ncbi:MAG: LptF/LptG family permease, partial [Pseudomonadota bacterium]
YVVKQDGNGYLVMENGHILRGPADLTPREVLAFKSYPIDLERFERRTAAHVWKPQERYLNELIYLDKKALEARRAGRYHAELHERFSGPLYPFLFVLLAVAFVGQAQSTRQNRTQMIAMAFVVAALFRGGGLALNNMVSLNAALAPLMYLLPALGIAMALWMIVRNEHPKPGLSAGDRLEMALGDLIGWISSHVRRRGALQPGE